MPWCSSLRVAVHVGYSCSNSPAINEYLRLVPTQQYTSACNLQFLRNVPGLTNKLSRVSLTLVVHEEQ